MKGPDKDGGALVEEKNQSLRKSLPCTHLGPFLCPGPAAGSSQSLYRDWEDAVKGVFAFG